uniref:Mannose-P-dolichol utilization defect 1b n=1 Tax=Oncorhynchus mykiss TaxID=8022 RepID=A0A8C7LWY1_ONCMY
MATPMMELPKISVFDPLKGLLLTYFMPESCYDEFFIHFNFLDVPCLKIVLSKGLGIGIILGSVMVKLPQILKLMGAKSAEGLSFNSVLLELLAITGTMTYSIANSFPFRYLPGVPHLFLMLQTVAIGFLIMHYGGNTVKGVLFLGVYFGLVALLLSPFTPMSVVMAMQASNMPAIIIGRVQECTLKRKGCRLGLSLCDPVLIQLKLFFLVSLCKQETGDSLMALTYVISSSCNGLIAAQLLYYWNSSSTLKKKTE